MVKTLTALLLSSTVILGQGFSFRDTAFLGSINSAPVAFVPTSIAGMAYYWNYTDLPLSGSVSNWTDRIQAAILTNGATANRPTNSANGIDFNTSSTAKLTNVVITLPQAKFSIWIAVNKAGVQGSPPGILFGEGSDNTFFDFNSSDVAVYFFSSTANALSTATSSGVYSLTYANAGTGSAGGGVPWLNGVPGVTFTDRAAVQKFDSAGNDTFGNRFHGTIKFIGIWTNTALTALNSTNLYTYSTTH